MIKQNLLTALPFYEAQFQQTFRHPAAQGNNDKLAILCRYSRMLPFLIKNTPAAAPNAVWLCKADGLSAIKIDSLLTLSTTTVDGIGYVYHEGQLDIPTPSTSVPKYSADSSDNPRIWDGDGNTTYAAFVGSGGYFYLDVSIGSPGNRYFSELLYIADVPEFPEQPDGCGFAYIRIEAVSTCPIGNKLPNDPLVSQKIFIKNGSVSSPQYPIERNVAEDGNGNEAPLWSKMRKLYGIRFLCSEAVADWAASLPLYYGITGPVNVTDETGWQAAGWVESVSVDWPEEYSGIVADVELRWYIEAVTQTACC